jgi:CRISPR-associated endonuclease Csn1
MSRSIPWRLGLDLGTSSLGWVVIDLGGPGGNPSGIRAAGVRIFDAGVDGDIEQGKDSSRAVVRREARQPRRQQWRRQKRKKNLFRLLQRLGLLPPSQGASSEDRKALLDQLDRELATTHLPPDDCEKTVRHVAHQKLPYLLRDKAVAGPVQPFELGRALYHLAQRRGYLSNRKSQSDDEEEGKVAAGIGQLDAKLNGETLGSYFARRHDPFQERIRRRYTARRHYQDEFQRIRRAQAAHHSQVSGAAWKQIERTIFFQRPLKSQKHLIGRCELEPRGKKWKHRRCPLALPIAQEFRILQKVNDLRVTVGSRYDEPLTEQERSTLLDELRVKPEMKWPAVRKLLFGKLARTAQFSIEQWDDKLIGHRTNTKMLAVFGTKWLELPEQQQEAVVLDVLHYRSPDALKKRARKVWGLDDEAAAKLAKTKLEDDHASHSKAALRKLVHGSGTVKGLKDHESYGSVRRALYPESFTSGKVHDELPPVNKWSSDIRNPAVIRALTELRKVVNALVRKYGRPESIHIELARDLKNSRKKRKEIHTKNEENRKRRRKAIAAMFEECGILDPNRSQVDKWLLADECNRACPYCGKAINMRALMGSDAEFNIEHIWPRRYLDNSYMNKTIACRTCNDRKGDRTPAQAFSGEQYEAILQRVAHFQGSASDAKLMRFKLETPPEGFVDRQLVDTRYNSRLAAEYLGTLFGGKIDVNGKLRIFTPTGQLTGAVRANWQLNDLLSETGEKSRDDHRHHAVDAIVVALMDQRLIQRMAEAAEESERVRDRHFFKSLAWPWPMFKYAVAEALEEIRVSHRPTHTVAGPLHAESIYSKPHPDGSDDGEYRIRKELHKLSAKEISGDQIVDPAVRRAVQEKHQQLGGGLPGKVFGDPANHPTLKTKKGGEVPIHKVRIRVQAKPRAIGQGVRQRNYVAGKDSNYASLIYTILDAEGKEVRWEHAILTRLDAHQRLSAQHGKPGEKILIPEETETRKFKFALRKNDMLEADGPDGERVLYRVQKLSKNEIQLCEHTRTTVTPDQRTPWDRITSIDNLRKRNARNVRVTPSGDVVEVTP